MSVPLINIRENTSERRPLRETPRGRRRRSRLASNIEFDGPGAELVAVGHVCFQVRHLKVAIVGGCSNAGERENRRSLHGELCNRGCSFEEEETKNGNPVKRGSRLHFVALTVKSL